VGHEIRTRVSRRAPTVGAFVKAVPVRHRVFRDGVTPHPLDIAGVGVLEIVA